MEESSPPNRYAQPEIFPWGRIVIFIVILVLIEITYGSLETGFTVGASEVDAIVGVTLSVFLAWLVPNLNLKLSHAIGLIWLNLFIVRFLSNFIEGYFFTDVYSSLSDLAVSTLYAGIFTALSSVAIVLVYFFPRPRESLVDNLKAILSSGTRAGWVVRILATGPIFLAVYFAFGMAVSPFVYPYYSDPSYGLKIPPLSTMLPVEIARGIIFGLILLPLVASMRFGRISTFVSVSMMLFVPGALMPLLQAPMPQAIIPYHLAEILGDSLVFGYILTWLYRPRWENLAGAAE